MSSQTRDTIQRQQFSVSAVRTPQDLTDAITLFTAYSSSLAIDLTFQDFATEMANMPGKYAPPTGALLLARRIDGTREAIGCVALRSLGHDGLCEMKRLYVDPDTRAFGVGKALAEAAVSEARRKGYLAMRLDTLQDMESARALYQRLGFVEIEAYYDTPITGTVFMELDLRV